MPEPRSLPLVRSPTRAQLIRFDLRYGLPTALGALRQHLSKGRLLAVLASYLLRSLRDPLRHIPRTGWDPHRETLVRHQLRAAVLIDDALRAASGLAETDRRAALADVISRTGAAFIAANVPMPTAAAWRGAREADRDRYALTVVERFFNAEVQDVDASAEHFAFDVSRCRFVELCAALDRPDLAPLFCAADSVFFERPDAPLKLVRANTLATRGPRCDFRFHPQES